MYFVILIAPTRPRTYAPICIPLTSSQPLALLLMFSIKPPFTRLRRSRQSQLPHNRLPGTPCRSYFPCNSTSLANPTTFLLPWLPPWSPLLPLPLSGTSFPMPSPSNGQIRSSPSSYRIMSAGLWRWTAVVELLRSPSPTRVPDDTVWLVPRFLCSPGPRHTWSPVSA